MTESEVPRLHPEVLEVVFSHLDGKSLARCEQVCKLWNELVQRISQRTDIWKRCCEKEIDRGTRLEVLDKSFPSWHLSCLSEAEWREVYKNWCQWQHLDSWGYKTRTICEDTHIAPVTCMRTSGTSVVTGHHYGDVFLWGDDDVVNVTLHVRHVTDLSLMVYGEDNVRDLKSLLPDIPENKSELFRTLTSSWPKSKVGDEWKKHRKEGIKKSFRNLFAVLSYDERVSVWQVTNSSGNIRAPEISKLHTLRIHSDPFAAISIWGAGSIQISDYIFGGQWPLNFKWLILQRECQHIEKHYNFPPVTSPPHHKCDVVHLIKMEVAGLLSRENFSKSFQVSAITYKGLCLPIYRGGTSNSYKLLQEETQHFSSPELWEDMDGRILRIFFWRYGISIVLTDERYMYVRIDSGRQVKYNTMPYLHSHPVTVLLYGEILLLGMASGTLYLYLLHHITDLLTLDLRAVYWKHSLSSDPIIAVDITETSNGPRIAAATKDKLYCIPFHQ
ncbi:uncharacterized protein [Periplaneta americana]|uniref:uncharacterized protein isoform X2 n=1 Tax=Periplaneta americana TaxID=6978 RepID=UPI0037E800C6